MNDVFIAVLWDEMQPGADLDSTIFLSRLVEEADTASLQSGPPNGCLQLKMETLRKSANTARAPRPSVRQSLR